MSRNRKDLEAGASLGDATGKIIVCSLSNLYSVIGQTDPEIVVSLLGPEWMIDPLPRTLASGNPLTHHQVLMDDIAIEDPGMTPPQDHHVDHILEIGQSWSGTRPILFHCWAGVSRSGAAALITLASRHPGREHHAAAYQRLQSPAAQPNKRLITLADGLLGADGRLINGVEEQGPGFFPDGEAATYLLDPNLD